MLILTLRTDKPEAELGLYNDTLQLAYETWQAHRQLAETIHLKIRSLLDARGYDLHNVEGLIVYKGPGSFTGLRIGATVANALSAELPAVIVGTNGQNWKTIGFKRLENNENDQLIIPDYGAAPRITQQKK